MSSPTIAELAKTYDPAAVEAEVYDFWLKNDCFKADPAHPGQPYSIVIPPPNVTGALHLGHAINTTLQDILIRAHRMRGFNTVWIPGIDHAGIATQAVVEKQLKEKEGLDRHQIGREGLVEKIWAWKQQYGDRILAQLKRLGCSCDWSRTRFTLDEMCARAVRETFFKLFKDGLIYRGKRLVNWDVHLQTSISDDEIYHEKVKTFLWHIKYPIVDAGGVGLLLPDHKDSLDKLHERNEAASGKGNPVVRATYRPAFMTVATTRPETLLGDTAVAVHSQDPRWNWAIGQFVELPLTGRKIPIIADDILVDMAFGSGVVKVTPAHDPSDYQVYQRHLGQSDAIDIINLLNPDGTTNENAGKYKGLKREVARKRVVEDLTAAGLLEKEEPYETEVGHSDRSKTAIEPYLSDQWFVKMAPLAEPALEVVRDGTIKFFPERHAQQYLAWLGEKRDWPISRQLWWGHRIPVWSLDEVSGLEHFQNVIASLKELRSKHPARIATTHFETGKQSQDQRIGELKGIAFFVSLADDGADLKVPLEALGFTQDPDVLDTWFSSALWPHSTLGWPEATADLAKWYPTSVLMTGRDIITLWVARMVMMGMYNMGKASDERGVLSDELKKESATHHSSLSTHRSSSIPFAHVAINPTILDGKGERMSKSKGNGVDPVDIIDTYGADALRFTLTQMATETQDARMPVKKDAQGRNTSEKFDGGRNFCTKLWNAAKFVLTNLEQLPGGLASASPSPNANNWSLIDQWIISRFNRTVTEANEAIAAYRFDQYHKACYDFFWRDFCDWYVEAAKPAMKDPARQTQTGNILASVLDSILRLMHPMIPFITERLWWQLNSIRPQRGLPGALDCPANPWLIHATWPTVGNTNETAEFHFSRMQEIIEAIRRVRNDYKIDPRKPVKVSIAARADSKRQVETNREMIELLAICTLVKVENELSAPENSARTMAAGVEIFVEGIIDPEAEKIRSARQRETLEKKRDAHRARLANPSYADKAPAHLVQQTRDELAATEEELGKLNA